MPRVVHVKHGLDVQYGAHHRGSRRNPSAAFQMEQVIDRKIMADMRFERLGIFRRFLYRRTRIRLFYDVIHEKSLAHGRTKRIHHQNRPIGVFFFEFLRRYTIAPLRARKSGGKRENQNVPTRGEKFFKMRLCRLRRHLIGRRHGSRTELRVKRLCVDPLPVLSFIVGSVHQKAEMNTFQPMLFIIFFGQIAGRIRNDFKKSLFHKYVLLYLHAIIIHFTSAIILYFPLPVKSPPFSLTKKRFCSYKKPF